MRARAGGGGGASVEDRVAALEQIVAAIESGAQRKKDEKSSVAMEDGRFPIRNAADLENAKRAIGGAAPA